MNVIHVKLERFQTRIPKLKIIQRLKIPPVVSTKVSLRFLYTVSAHASCRLTRPLFPAFLRTLLVKFPAGDPGWESPEHSLRRRRQCHQEQEPGASYCEG